MNSKEFIDELRMRLRRLPADEVDSAVRFYEEYLNEAAQIQNGEQALAALGSPSAVASKIIGEYAVSDAERVKGNQTNPFIITILAICAAPIALPLALSIMAIVFALAVVVFALGASGAIIAVSGIACILAGIWTFFYDFATAIFYIGGGMFVLALGMAVTALIVKLGKMVFLGLQRWLGKILIRRGTQ